MKVDDLRFYARPFSEAESSWPDDVRKRMKSRSQKVVFRRLGFMRMVRFGFQFAKAHRRIRALDLTPFRERGLNDDRFIQTQLEYLAFFSALVEIVGVDEAIDVSKQVMDEASIEPMLLCLPNPDNVREVGEPFEVMKDYFRAMPEASVRGGCHHLEVTEDTDDALQFDVSWCVWLELARAAGVPEACIPNCHADQLVFPEYFDALGITYKRTQTLACGGTCCDFRFERAGS